MIKVTPRPYKKRGVTQGFEVDVFIHFPDGLPPHRVRKKSPFKTERQSIDWGMRLGVEVSKRGRPTETPKAPPKKEAILFKAFVPIYLKRHVLEEDLAKSTYRLREAEIERYFMTQLGEMPLDQIDATVVANVRMSLRLKRGGSPRSANHRNKLMTILHHMLQKAYEWGLMSSPPPPFPKPAKVIVKEIELYDDDELKRLVKAAKDYCIQAYLIVMIGSNAGLRVAEMLGLRWSDIDLVKKVLTVRQQEVFRGEVSKPKSKKPRKIEMTEELCEALTSARHLGERVLVTREGVPATRTQLEDWLTMAEKRAQLATCKSPHKLRHSFATRLLANGATPKAVQALMGHSTLAQTMVYLHLRDGETAEAIRRLSGDRLEPKEEKVEK